MEQSIQFPDKNFENIFASFISMIKAMQIPYEYFYDEKLAEYYAMTDLFSMWGAGKNISAAIDDLVHSLRTVIKLCADRQDWDKLTFIERAYALKILLSSDDEIKSCLTGKVCEDI